MKPVCPASSGTPRPRCSTGTPIRSRVSTAAWTCARIIEADRLSQASHLRRGARPRRGARLRLLHSNLTADPVELHHRSDRHLGTLFPDDLAVRDADPALDRLESDRASAPHAGPFLVLLRGAPSPDMAACSSTTSKVASTSRDGGGRGEASVHHVGMATFLILLTLAVTSNRFAVRRLGRRWQKLHRLVYVAAIFAVVHFWWLVKADITEPRRWAVLAALSARRACVVGVSRAVSEDRSERLMRSQPQSDVPFDD